MRRPAVLWALAALWAALYAASLIAPFVLEATGDGFPRGINRVMAFLQLQIAALVPALVLWAFGNHLPRGPRLASRVPALLALLLALGIVALIVGVYLSRPAPDSSPPAPVTVPVDPSR
jgi:hypothetical protein